MDSEQAVELFGFLKDKRVDVRNTAAKYVAGMSGNPSLRSLFHLSDFCAVRNLMPLITDEPLTAHDALSALINLSADDAIVHVLATNEFMSDLVVQTILPKNVNADLCCMLLNNLTKHSIVVDMLLPKQLSDDSNNRAAPTHRIDNLLEIFIRGETAKYNPSASFHFLAGVFANIASATHGAEFFFGRSTIDNTLRLSKLVVFTEHSNAIRRGGVVSAIKNCCLGAGRLGKCHDVLLSNELNLAVYILLPLSGSEDYTDEEMDGMPDALQFLEPSKQREQDAVIRLMLVEILVLLTTTRIGRDHLRSIKAYPVVQKLHLKETSEEVQETIERLVNMLMREETEPAGAITDGSVDADQLRNSTEKRPALQPKPENSSAKPDEKPLADQHEEAMEIGSLV